MSIFQVGLHRPIYFWAGPGTIRMNRLKFLNAPVDEQVHLEAYSEEGAKRVALDMACNWAYLTCNWGFPPEIEREDWETFCRAVPIYHKLNVRVFGYVQTSNYVVAGSFRQKDWFARDPRGRPFYYYTGRYMACWLHPEWQDHLMTMVRGVVDSGADGVFFDNLWHGVQPVYLGGHWLGAAGCFCRRCRQAFSQHSGWEIPQRMDFRQEATRAYLRWRSQVVTQTLSKLAAYARSLNPQIVISANDFDPIMRPSYVLYGIDLEGLSQIQDVLMIENLAWPSWREGNRQRPARLVNNALTLRTARALARGTPISTISYDRGIGFDPVYSPRRYQQAIAEAAACGAVAVVKGTEYFCTEAAPAEGKKRPARACFTLLTAPPYASQRAAVGDYHRWLEKNAFLFDPEAWETEAPIGLIYPGERLWEEWPLLAPLYFGAAQALTTAGIPWQVVLPGDQNLSPSLKLLIDMTPEARSDLEALPARLSLLSLPGWEIRPPSPLIRAFWVRSVLPLGIDQFYRSYFERRFFRSLLDRLGVVQFLLKSPHFALPPLSAQKSLIEVAQNFHTGPRISSTAPVLVEIWRHRGGGKRAIHLMNYADTPQSVEITFSQPRRILLLTPDGEEETLAGVKINVLIDVYTILLVSDDQGPYPSSSGLLSSDHE